jgi:short-subunit dehydrogenase
MPKSMLVIGAGPGIGLETARRFAQEGYDVVLASRDPAKLGDQIVRLRAGGCRVTTESVDAADGRAVTALVERYADQIDVLLYNAAAIVWGPTIDQLTTESLDTDLQVGLSSALRAIKAALPAMTAKRNGTMLLTGGRLADDPKAAGLTLSAVKAGLRAAGKALFEPLKSQNVHIATVTVATAVAPGSVEAAEIAQRFWQAHAASPEAWIYEERYAPGLIVPPSEPGARGRA